jgi:hypothetical protein
VALSGPGGIAAFVLGAALAFVLGSGGVFAPEADAFGSRSTLTVVRGAVAVSHDGSDFHSARLGDVIEAGDTVRTDAGAAAEITYVEGSSVRMDADTQIVVRSRRTDTDAGTVIAMMRTMERSWNVVTKLVSGGSRYDVRTPTSTASVRG